MERFQDAVLTTTGDAVPGAVVSVFFAGTTSLAPLFSDNGVTVLANPITTGTDGEYAFYAQSGAYDIQIQRAGLVTETRPGVILFDPNDGGPILISSSISSLVQLLLSAPASTAKRIRLMSALLDRWRIESNNVAESGSNAGSNFVIERYNDAGALLGAALSIVRSSGAATFGGDLTLSPAASVTPPTNGQVAFQLTSNTQLTFRVRGSDGVVRSGNITLA